MEDLKSQLFTSFVSGVGKTTGGLVIVGVFLKLWGLYNQESFVYNYSKSKTTQTGNKENEETDTDTYRKILDNLADNY